MSDEPIITSQDETWTISLAVEEIHTLRRALWNFVKPITDYDTTGVWPDNGTIRRLADEGLAVLQGHQNER